MKAVDIVAARTAMIQPRAAETGCPAREEAYRGGHGDRPYNHSLRRWDRDRCATRP